MKASGDRGLVKEPEQVTPGSGISLASEVVESTLDALFEGYEPLDMEEKYWALRFSDGSYMANAAAERYASVRESDMHTIQRLVVSGAYAWTGYSSPSSAKVVQVTVRELLQIARRLFAGIVVYDGYPRVVRRIEAKPGERP